MPELSLQMWLGRHFALEVKEMSGTMVVEVLSGTAFVLPHRRGNLHPNGLVLRTQNVILDPGLGGILYFRLLASVLGMDM